jgi:hypothetical protein
MVAAGQVSASLAQQTIAEAGTTKEAIQALKEGIAVAKKAGKTRVTKRHLNGNGNGAKKNTRKSIPLSKVCRSMQTS